ncbi:hypothetical protein [Streptococcus porcinus]|uniref:DNA repair ATPase n=1 Tax=Streptococcus porcinus TaxID=1340 RepID=A0A7V9WSC1_STRPO|nr:hypothetical protein [Streptococcus porcinus]MBA2796181.1 hypothetical protein [Streptococcus porcinus]
MKELKKLSRKELLELLLEQQLLIEKQEKELKEIKDKLNNQKIKIETSGTLAEASLRLSGIFEAAQEAADIYLENIKRQSDAMRTDDEKRI